MMRLMCLAIWRKKLYKVLVQFKDDVIRVDGDSLRNICFPQRENLLDDTPFQNWHNSRKEYAAEALLLKDLDLAKKGKSAHVITTLVRRWSLLHSTIHWIIIVKGTNQ